MTLTQPSRQPAGRSAAQPYAAWVLARLPLFVLFALENKPCSIIEMWWNYERDGMKY